MRRLVDDRRSPKYVVLQRKEDFRDGRGSVFVPCGHETEFFDP